MNDRKPASIGFKRNTRVAAMEPTGSGAGTIVFGARTNGFDPESNGFGAKAVETERKSRQ